MPSRGRFQSHLFSQMSQQSLRWRDQVGQWLRRGKIVVTWGTQIALYPIYAGFQSVRAANRQLSQAQASSERSPFLKRWLNRLLGKADVAPALPPQSSAPVLQTLSLVQTWVEQDELTLMAESASTETGVAEAGSVETRATKTASAFVSAAGAIATVSPPILDIQGIASCLQRRELVLVAVGNRRIEGLSVAQQGLLRQRMAEVLAAYWRDRHTFDMAEDPVLPLPPPAPSKYLLPPLRWFYRLMAWEQQGQVAIATDLFHESTLQLPCKPTPSTAEPASISNSSGETGITAIAVPHALPAFQGIEAVALSLVNPQRQNSPEASQVIEVPSTEPSSYVDAEATVVGYVQHPLEQLLNWLDRGMLWLEGQWEKLWQWWRERN